MTGGNGKPPVDGHDGDAGGGNGEPPVDGKDNGGGGGGGGGGFGKPPRRNQFPPGVSGNPKGRPKRARGKHQQLVDIMDQPTRDMFKAEMRRAITINDGRRELTISAIQMIIRSMVKSAAAGGQQAQRTAITVTLELEAQDAAANAECVRLARELKERGYEILAQYRARGRPEPELVPHPDDIFIDEQMQRVDVRGPLTVEQKAKLQDYLAFRDRWEEDFEYCRSRYDADGRCEAGRILALQSQQVFDIFNDPLPERYKKGLKNRLAYDATPGSKNRGPG